MVPTIPHYRGVIIACISRTVLMNTSSLLGTLRFYSNCSTRIPSLFAMPEARGWLGKCPGCPGCRYLNIDFDDIRDWGRVLYMFS